MVLIEGELNSTGKDISKYIQLNTEVLGTREKLQAREIISRSDIERIMMRF